MFTVTEITAVLCFKLGVFDKALAINVPTDPMNSLQKFLHHPGDFCEAKGLMLQLMLETFMSC